jgi:hypothetical protein
LIGGMAGMPNLTRVLAVAATWVVTGAGIAAAAAPETAVPAAPPPSPAPAAVVPDADDLLRLAVRSSQSVGYRGTQTVLVWDSDGSDAAVLDVVVGGPGLMRLEVPTTARNPGWVLVQRGDQRSMYGLGSGLLDQAPADLLETEDFEEHEQRLLDKYTLVLDGPAQLLGRNAWKIDILRRSDKRLVERWTIDAATGVILQREGFQRQGRLERLVSFNQLEVPYDAPLSDFSMPAVSGPRGAATQERVVPRTGGKEPELGGFRAPAALPAGYHLDSQARLDVGDETVAHVTYSDGLEPLSLFRQPGVLHRSSLPQGAKPAKLKKVQGYAWESFPRGLAWQDGQASFVLVGAASVDELTRIANALPQSGLHRSIPQRIGHFMHWLRRSIGSIF